MLAHSRPIIFRISALLARTRVCCLRSGQMLRQETPHQTSDYIPIFL
jgi:hypothetical protein